MKPKIEWSKIATRYLIIALTGSMVVVIGTYVLAQYEWDKESLAKEARRSVDSVVEGVRTRAPDRETVREHVGKAAERIRETTRREVTPPTRPPPADTVSHPPREHVAPADKPAERWGVVTKPNAPIYSLQGEFLLAAEAGTLLDVLDVRDTSEGKLAIVNAVDHSGLSNVLVHVENASLRPGSLEQASAREKKLRSDHARITQRIADRKAELARQSRERNPHARSFEQARDAYLGFARRAQELTEKRDNASGARRMEYADELRRMLAERGPLRSEYEDAKRRFEEWEASAGDEDPAVHDDKLAMLRSRQQSLEREINRMRLP